MEAIKEKFEIVKDRYLELPQDIRFGIPVVLGMAVLIPIAWIWLSAPRTCEQAKRETARLERLGGDGSAEHFRESTAAIAAELELCYNKKISP